jgi:transcriptional regulator with XRE-family HTH domain
MQRVGQRIAEARAVTGLSQQQLAAHLGLTRSSVANIEGGRQSVDAVQLAQLARALRVTLDALLPADDLPPAPPVPHVVEVVRVWQVTCRICDPGQPFWVAVTPALAEEARKAHVAEMLERDAAGPAVTP